MQKQIRDFCNIFAKIMFLYRFLLIFAVEI